MTDTPVMTREDIDAQHGPHAWTPEQLLARLQELEIDTNTIEHDPMWTVEDSRRLRSDLSEDGHCKSLFLRNKKGQMWLVVMLEDQRLDIKALGQALDQRLSFAKPDRLMAYLGVIPGSVTPFGVVHDTDQAVQVVLQKRMMDCAVLHYHPLRNYRTTSLSSADLLAFLRAEAHEPVILDF
ncbi:MAG: prolyl-tRNA synthetase associated domain-containing protein [Alphaproteobacteria bacterium]